MDRNDQASRPEKAHAGGKSLGLLVGGEADLFENADTAILRVNAEALEMLSQ